MVGVCMTLIDNESDKGLFKKLYELNRNKLMGVSFGILHDEKLAEDAVSETFLYIARKFSRLRELSFEQLSAYSYIAVKNISRDIIKGSSKEICSDFYDIQNDSFLTNDEMKSIDKIFLREKISMLKEEDREILMLFYFYRYSIKEIAGLKKIKYDAAQKRMQKAKKRLKILLGGNENDRK